MDTYTLPGRGFILNDRKTIGLRNIRAEAGGSVASCTAVIFLYDSSGSALLSGTSMTVTFNSDNTRAKAVYSLVTGSGGTITTAGTYRAVYKVTFSDGSIWEWQQQIVVKARPF